MIEMPEKKTPSSGDTETLRESIARLSKQSEKLRKDAERNASQAAEIASVVKAMEKRIAEAEDAKVRQLK